MTTLRPPRPNCCIDFNTLTAVCDEIIRARLKSPDNRYLLAALTKEVGELAHAMILGKASKVRLKAIQVACIALRIFEEGDRIFDDLTTEES